MSIQALAWVLENSQSELADRLVLIAIANHADAHGRNAWPSADQIAKEARVHRATVFRALARLCDLGELEVDPGGQGPGATNAYQIVGLEGSQIATLKGSQRVASCDPSGGAKGRILRQKGSHPATQTVLEPKDINLSVVTRGSATGKPQPDRLAEWLVGTAGANYAEALETVVELRDAGIGDLVIEEAIGYCRERDDIRSLQFVKTVAYDWMNQRDRTF